SSRRRHTRWPRDWSSDVCSSDLDRARTGRDVSAAAEARSERAQLGLAEQRTDVLVDVPRRTGEHREVERRVELLESIGERTEERSEERRVGKEWWAREGDGLVRR